MTWSLTPLARTFEAAMRDLTEKKPEVRASAVSDLVPFLAQPEHRDEVVRAGERMLGDAHPLVRQRAATLLGVAGEARVIPELVARSASDDDAIVRQMAMEALGAIDDERARAAVRRALGDERDEVRFQAVMAVLHFPDEAEAKAALGRAFEDRDPSIRYVALRTAEERGFDGDADLAALAASRLDDASHEVKVAAALFLARFHADAARPVVLALLRGTVRTREQDDLAHALEIALDVAGVEARPLLEKRAFSFSIFPDGSALPAQVGLAKHGDARAKAKILKGLDARSPERRAPFVIAAGRARLVEARVLIAAMDDLGEIRDQALRDLDAAPG